MNMLSMLTMGEDCILVLGLVLVYLYLLSILGLGTVGVTNEIHVRLRIFTYQPSVYFPVLASRAGPILDNLLFGCFY